MPFDAKLLIEDIMAADDCCYNNQYPVFTSPLTHCRLNDYLTTINDEEYCISIPIGLV